MIQTGSKVELVNDQWDQQQLDSVSRMGDTIVFPSKNIVYTVRAVVEIPSGTGLQLDELVNAEVTEENGQRSEPAFNVERFIEVQDGIDVVFGSVNDEQARQDRNDH
ncbi:MAG: hypothetical protein INR69_07075 [Mucilaginibacter polytrichastri]|nr:hypothetical protein [Mucilaginibacter polytrichastri]